VPDLGGKTVVLTRAHGDNAELARRFALAGALTIELPCVRAEALADRRALDEALASLRRDDWLVVTSRHGADAVSSRTPFRARVAAIGAATAARLREGGRSPDFVPSVATGACLARELPPRGGDVLLARSDHALDDLPRGLGARGFTVREVVAYRTIVGIQGDATALRVLLEADAAQVVIAVSSPSALAALVTELGVTLVARAMLLVGGPTTERLARERLGSEARIEIVAKELADVAHR
jgi:uroporphyrinogen-III synthase/uroporphyrinogen III methyltransferase/synthase